MSTSMGTETPDTSDDTGRHPLNVGQLVMGIAFLGLVGVWAAIEADWIGDDDIRWLLPVPWVLAGLAGLLAVALGGRRRQAPAPRYDGYGYAATYPAPEAYDDGTDDGVVDGTVTPDDDPRRQDR